MVITLVLLVTGLKRGKLNSGGGGGWTEVFGGDGEREGGVLTKEEVARIWEWEVVSGHHPSLADGEYYDPAGWNELRTNSFKARPCRCMSTDYIATQES